MASVFSYSCEVPMPFIRLLPFIPLPLLFMPVPLLFIPALLIPLALPFMPVPLFMPEPDPVAERPVAVELVVPLPPPILVCASAGPAIESASAIIISFFILYSFLGVTPHPRQQTGICIVPKLCGVQRAHDAQDFWRN
jgi:hypothetical protein